MLEPAKRPCLSMVTRNSISALAAPENASGLTNPHPSPAMVRCYERRPGCGPTTWPVRSGHHECLCPPLDTSRIGSRAQRVASRQGEGLGLFVVLIAVGLAMAGLMTVGFPGAMFSGPRWSWRLCLVRGAWRRPGLDCRTGDQRHRPVHPGSGPPYRSAHAPPALACRACRRPCACRDAWPPLAASSRRGGEAGCVALPIACPQASGLPRYCRHRWWWGRTSSLHQRFAVGWRSSEACAIISATAVLGSKPCRSQSPIPDPACARCRAGGPLSSLGQRSLCCGSSGVFATSPTPVNVCSKRMPCPVRWWRWPAPRSGPTCMRRSAGISWARCRTCAGRRRSWMGSSFPRAGSSRSGGSSAGPAAPVATSPGGCCNRAAWCRRSAAGCASCQTLCTMSPCRRDARLWNVMPIRAACRVRRRRRGGTRRSPGTTWTCGSARRERCAYRSG